MVVLNNVDATYISKIKKFNEKLKALKREKANISDKIFEAQSNDEDLYTTMLYDNLYIIEKQIRNFRQIKKDIYLETCN